MIFFVQFYITRYERIFHFNVAITSDLVNINPQT